MTLGETLGTFTTSSPRNLHNIDDLIRRLGPRQKTRAIEPRYRPPGQRGILGGGLRGRAGRPPFWRTLIADWPGA